MQTPSSNAHSGARVLAVGEVLWDCFPDSKKLGGAPLNFAAQLARIGDCAGLLSAVGDDDLGRDAAALVAGLGLDRTFLQVRPEYPTGAAIVEVSDSGSPHFTIVRPAAYDAVSLDDGVLHSIREWAPDWIAYGSLLSALDAPFRMLLRLFDAMPEARLFCDVNLRPACVSETALPELLGRAEAVKINEDELVTLAGMYGLPHDSIESFARAGSARFGWKALAVTLGGDGSAVWRSDGAFARAAARPIQVADTVGAGDAFSAAFLHGYHHGWPVERIADFANRVGAIVASRAGAIPDWTLEEALAL